MQSFSASPILGPPGSGFNGGRRWIFTELDSTNSWALAHAGELEPGDIVQAIRQTAGRGRLDRTWIAPPDRSLTFTIVLNPAQFTVAPPLIGQIAALGIVQGLAVWNLPARVKWPNDVLVNNRKIAGLLLESGSRPDRLVLGIGLNVNLTPADLPPAQLRRPATSLQLETGRTFELEAVFRALIRGLEESARRCTSPAALRSAWSEKDALQNQTLQIETADETVSGRYRGINLDGQLILETEEGFRREFWSGDVERVNSLLA
jgi:BirA family biotin operon repressor/biotin-[acetyl-CoA-carboxylase] ligase